MERKQGEMYLDDSENRNWDELAAGGVHLIADDDDVDDLADISDEDLDEEDFDDEDLDEEEEDEDLEDLEDDELEDEDEDIE